MTAGKSIEIRCVACGAETLVRREPVYEGFRKVGDRFVCAACGHVYADEKAVPYLAANKPAVFGEADRPERVEVFEDGEKQRNCRYCKHYVVNPFRQWCGRHRREVEATDLCDQFDRKVVEVGPGSSAEKQGS